MKLFLRDILCFVLLQVLIFGGLIAAFHRPAYKDPIMAATRIKHERLEHDPAPRIIVVGGSNVLYGLDSPTLRERLPHYNPINMGLVGGLRLDYMLNEIEPHLQAGDIVVLALEYRQLMRQFSGRQSAVTLMQLLACRPANVQYLHWGHVREILDNGLLPHTGYMLRDGVENLRKMEINVETREINEFGDLLEHRGKPQKKHVARRLPMARQISPAMHDVMTQSINRINAFKEVCDARGVTVVYTHPPIPDVHFDTLEATIAQLNDRLRTECRLPVITAPEDMVFPLDRFFDSAYHLGGRGAVERTHRLVDALDTYLHTAAREKDIITGTE